MDVAMFIVLILKVVALAMGIVSIVPGYFSKETSNKTHMMLLGIGLLAMSLAAIR